MSSQEKSYERLNQKRRTRTELLRSARELASQGMTPSVAEVADHAGISKATAYRYFSAQDEMLREALLDGVAGLIHIEPARDGLSHEQLWLRLEDVVRQIFVMVRDNEAMFRALLSSSMSATSEQPRGARRVVWLETALAPLRKELGKHEFDHLLHALSLATGIETLVVMKDIWRLDDESAEQSVLWTAKTLYEGAIARLKH